MRSFCGQDVSQSGWLGKLDFQQPTSLCAAGELCPLRGAGAACAALADQASQLLLQLPGPRRCNLPTLGPAAAGVSSGGHRDSALAAAPAVARRPQAAAGQPLQPDGQPTAPPMLAAALVSVGRLPAPAATNSPDKRRRALAAAAGIAGCSPGSRRTLRDGARSCSSPCTSLPCKDRHQRHGKASAKAIGGNLQPPQVSQNPSRGWPKWQEHGGNVNCIRTPSQVLQPTPHSKASPFSTGRPWGCSRRNGSAGNLPGTSCRKRARSTVRGATCHRSSRMVACPFMVKAHRPSSGPSTGPSGRCCTCCCACGSSCQRFA